MIALIQRVTNAQVDVAGACIGKIEQGILAFIGVQPKDGQAQAQRLAERLLSYRVFADNDDKMNLSVTDITGGLLLVPQFTLAANTDRGNRPSFSSAATPEEGKLGFNRLVEACQQRYANIATGEFGANMQISLCNDGPVTFWLQVPPPSD